MTCILKSLGWAFAIIAVSIVAKENGLGDAESFAITMGLVAAAMSSLRPAKTCGTV